MKKTLEQEKILKAFKKNRVLKVNAVAGSGKSTTLRMLAEANEESSLYLCFNKVIQQEAEEKFPEHVECRTSHSLAFATHGYMLKHKLSRPKGRYVNVAQTSAEVAKFFNITEFVHHDDSVPANTIGSLVRQTVNRYQNSADDKLSKKHLPYSDLDRIEKDFDGINTKALTGIVLKKAERLWEERCDPYSVVLAQFDTYLKLWQLSKPTLGWDVIYVDECQDTNPTVLDVVSRQTHCKVVYVGDTHQSIYQFRGAVNAMETITAPTYTLSKSFRYGQEIADVATTILSGDVEIEGCESIESEVAPFEDKKFTHIFRTNGLLLQTAVERLQEGKSVHCEVNTYDFIKLLESASALRKKDFKNVKHEDITPYSSWKALMEDAKEMPELKRVSSIVNRGEEWMFIDHLRSLNKKKGDADILMTTAHKSKGQEWENVLIASDFPFPEDGDYRSVGQQEVNLMYVAVTRAINKLEISEAE